MKSTKYIYEFFLYFNIKIFPTMFQALVERILNKILGEYVEDFSSENLKIGLWSGEVVIKNVKLKKQIIKLLNLPFNLKYSRLGCLKMNIPWSSLASSKIQVVVQGLELLITQIPEADWVCRNTKIVEARKKQIEQYCEAVVNDFAKKSEKSKKEEEEQGYFSKMIVRIIDNIQVTVKDIHIRYEDEITKKYSFGVTLEELKIFTVNKNDEPEFIDRTKKQYENQPLRKKLLLSNFGFYWNEATNFFPENHYHQYMIKTIARKSNPKKQMDYLILMSSNAHLLQRQSGKQFTEPQINLFVDVHELKIEITNDQLQQIVTQGERLQKYSKKVKSQNRKKLTQLQMIANRELFFQIFPRYYEKTLSEKDMEKMEKILQKMQAEIFMEGIKKYLMEKQKKKLMEEKKKKSAGWFSGPKELTQKEKQEIQNFLKNNFGQQISIVKRPQDYEYIRVNFNLHKLQIAVANKKSYKNCKEGLRISLDEIQMKFNLRQKGYNLDFKLDDLRVDLFKRSLQNSQQEESSSIVQKLIGENEGKKEYIHLEVRGYPLDKPHLDVEILVKTQQLLILFDPRIIKIGMDFANIKVSAQNTQAVFETYGQIKNKATNAATSTIQKPIQKKSFISLDVTINAVNVILYMDPLQRDQDCWALVLGQTKIFSDEETLKKPDFRFDEPMEKYCLSLSNLSLTHFKSTKIFLENRHSKVLDYKSRVVDDLAIDFQAEMFQNNTTEIPKIKGRAAMHNLNLYLSEFTYEKIQKISACFAFEEQEVMKKEKEDLKTKEKSEVMKSAKKIGIVYSQKGFDNPKKFIGVLSGGYVYLYSDKKDIHYAEYYYVKNSVFQVATQTLPHQKPYAFEIVNSVNRGVLAFDKENVMEDWIAAIKKQDEKQFESIIEINEDEEKLKKVESIKEKNPNLLNFEVIALIKQIKIITLLEQDKNITISIEKLSASVRLHELKICLGISLQKILLTDNIYTYKMKKLQQFLHSVSLEGFDKLIDIQIQQLNYKHPDYNYVENAINVNFGKLQCHYKPETVQNLMLFFLPKPAPKASKIQVPESTLEKSMVSTISQNTEVVDSAYETRRRLAVKILCQILMNQPQKKAIKVNLNIEEVSVGLINRKNKVYFAEAQLKKFHLDFSQSSRRMLLKGTLGQISYIDYSAYPYTIYEEQQEYTKKDYLVRAIDSERDMVYFDIQMLQFPNEKGKKMLIYTQIKDLQASYIQQPVLRVLAYLTEQMLPSLTPSSPNSPRQLPKNDTKPELSAMELVTELQNIRALVEPRTDKKEQVRLNVGKISVKNDNFYRDYLRNAEKVPEEERVLVQNYSIKMKNIDISVTYNEKYTKLTNDLDFDVSCDLIQNSPFYKNLYGDRYLPGMRIICELSPFLMKINHDDYNFLMKCLFWNISYDDNAEGYMFDGPPNVDKDSSTPPPSDPFFLTINMNKISLCVTEDDFPISVLVLNKMKFNFEMNENGMEMDLSMKNLYGTSLAKVKGREERSVQRGMFNSFGYEKFYDTKDLYSLDKLVQFFHHNEILYTETTKPVMFFQLAMGKNGDLFMQVAIQELKIAIQLRNLLILSKLALMEDSIQPPKSQIVPIKAPPPPSQGGKMQMVVQLNNFMASLSDKRCKNYVVMQGSTVAKLLMLPSHKEEKVLEMAAKTQSKRFLELGSHVVELRNFSIYFCNVKNQKNKRYILKPLHLFISFKQFYQKIKKNMKKQQEAMIPITQVQNTNQSVILLSQIQGGIEKLIFESSIKDLVELNIIAQDNLSVLSETAGDQKPKEKPEEKKEETIDNLKQTKKVNTEAVKKDMKAVEKKILDKMTANIKLEPIQFQIVNDCNNNFMPVLQFILQESTLLFSSDALKMHYFQNLIFNVGFFNPRSSSYEPVIEKYQINLNYLNLKTDYGPLNKIIVESSEIQELKEMRINVSTQFISSMMATLKIWKEEQKKREKEKEKEELVVVEKSMVFKEQQQFEVSPFIIENLTNSPIFIHRTLEGKEDTFKVPSKFHGPVRLSENVNDVKEIKFTFFQKIYNLSLDHYGIVRIPNQKSYFLEFKIDKLNRILRFIGAVVVKNCTSSGLYLAIYNREKNKVGENMFIEGGKMMPVYTAGFFQVSFNNNTFTHLVQPSKLGEVSSVKAESGKFQLSLTKKKRMPTQAILQMRSPLIINNCLPKNISIQFIVGGKTLSTKEIKSQMQHEVFANEDLSNLQFKIVTNGFYWSREFFMRQNKIGEEQDLYLSDRIQGGTTIKILFDKRKNSNQFILNIYCKAFIISELDESINVYGNLQKDEKNEAIEKYYMLGGQNEFCNQKQDKTVLVGSETGNKVRICGQGCLIDFSEPVPISGLGINNTRIVINKTVNGRVVALFTIIGADISLKEMVQGSNIFSRKITLRFRSIVLNHSGFDMYIKEEGSSEYFFGIQDKEKKPFHFTMPQIKDRAQKLIFKAPLTKESVPIMSNNLGTIHFRLYEMGKEKYHYFKLVIEEIKSYIFYEIKRIAEEDLPYQIIVKSPQLEVQIPQLQAKITKKDQPVSFINEIPHQPFKLGIKVRAIGTNRVSEQVVEADNLNYMQKMRFYQEGVTKTFIPSVVYVIFNDSKKFIVVDEIYNAEQDNTQEYETTTMNLKLDKLSISLIQNHESVDQPYESFYFYLYNLEFISQMTNKRSKYQAKLQFLQLDQSEPFNVPNPVILTPYKYKQFTEETEKKKPKYIFNSYIEIDSSFVKNTFFNMIAVQMNDLVLKVSTILLKIVLKMAKEFTEVVNSQEDQHILQRKVNTWSQEHPPVQGSKTFIKAIKIAPFTVEISAEIKLDQLDTQSVLFFGTVLNALGVVITNIEGAPIFFDGVELSNCVDTMQGINQKLMVHYKSTVLRQLYKVFGSLNILGNPVGLFRNISTGFKDLKDKPSQGFVEGPLQFGKGLAQGTTSLITHSVGGALNSVQKFTGTVASGLAVLTFDKEFQEMREKERMKKPKHVFEGIEKGGKAVFHGFKDGITGLFTQPYENAKKEGVVGFFKGTAKGVAGVVVKPVTGVIDFASKTTEGLKNTALYLEDKPNENRIRYPRVFYTECSTIRDYNPLDSKLFGIINKTKYEEKYGFENPLFINSYIIQGEKFLLLLKEDIVMIQEQKIDWAVPIQTCKVKEEGIGVRVQGEKRQWYSRKINEFVPFNTKDDQLDFVKEARVLQKSMREQVEQSKYAGGDDD